MLSQNLDYVTTIREPKYLIIGSFGPLRFMLEDLQLWGLRVVTGRGGFGVQG